MKTKYGANEKSNVEKYHIQTSGRSLHAQEIDLMIFVPHYKALYAIYDNCNSLHTIAYESNYNTYRESLRRAMAIQLIIKN
jgi:methylmalonyl-CoA mutase